MKSTHELFVIFTHRKMRYWNVTRLVGVKRRKPSLQPGQIAFKLQIEVPESAFDVPVVPVIIDASKAIQPRPTLSNQPE